MRILELIRPAGRTAANSWREQARRQKEEVEEEREHLTSFFKLKLHVPGRSGATAVRLAFSGVRVFSDNAKITPESLVCFPLLKF